MLILHFKTACPLFMLVGVIKPYLFKGKLSYWCYCKYPTFCSIANLEFLRCNFLGNDIKYVLLFLTAFVDLSIMRGVVFEAMWTYVSNARNLVLGRVTIFLSFFFGPVWFESSFRWSQHSILSLPLPLELTSVFLTRSAWLKDLWSILSI